MTTVKIHALSVAGAPEVGDYFLAARPAAGEAALFRASRDPSGVRKAEEESDSAPLATAMGDLAGFVLDLVLREEIMSLLSTTNKLCSLS